MTLKQSMQPPPSELLMKETHDREDYAVVVPKELLAQAARTRAMFNVLLVVIAGISLLVGGIGIMNIMLAASPSEHVKLASPRGCKAKRYHCPVPHRNPRVDRNWWTARCHVRLAMQTTISGHTFCRTSH